MIWNDLAEAVELELQRHPRDYLRQHTISKTMHPMCRPLTHDYWKDLQKSTYFLDEILPAAIDGPVGAPFEFVTFPTISPQTVQHAWYIDLLLRRLGIRVAEVGHIVELGGGYGNFARIVRRMGHKGRYQIADLPQIHKLQRTYLNHTVSGHGVEFISTDQVENGDLLVATFSVSEMPLPLRKQLEGKYPHFQALLFATTKGIFDGVDNNVYFPGLAERIGGHYFKDPHRSAWFVTCKR